ncbi:MAG TPA: cytochrome c peroxidase, partial [Bryobacteraceae bacterium]|nr:cytochrome c peroxidase [Bryobacteraceae bacterium]
MHRLKLSGDQRKELGLQGAFFGGNFWDSRATAYPISPDADQAMFPPVDPAEMGFPDTACITFRLSQAGYRPLFEEVWGTGSFTITFPANTEQICDTPNVGGSATPVALSPADRTRSNDVYNEWGLSLSAYEHSLSVSPFTSKFDAFLVWCPINNFTFGMRSATVMSEVARMGRPNTALVISDPDREQLRALVRSHSMPHSLVRRA